MAKNRKAPATGQAAGASDHNRANAVDNSAALAHEDSTTTARESTQSEAVVRDWLTHFPATSRARIGLWFNLLAKWTHGRMTPTELIARVRQRTTRHARAGYEPQCSDACRVLKALEEDPQGALNYAQAVIAYQALPPAEQAQVKAAKSEGYRRAAMAAKPPTDKQLLCLRCLGYTGMVPENRLAACRREASVETPTAC